MVIVTNTEHADHITKIGGNAFVCEDPLPCLPDGITMLAKSMRKSILFICSFDVDEPYKEAFVAAKYLLNDGFTFYVSGNYNKVKINPEDYAYINFLGHVPYSLFYSYLISSDIILDLTACENCLVCGAYEAMAAEKPLVTSDTKALRNYFTHGTKFTKHDPESITRSIRNAYENKDNLSDQIRQWKIVAHNNIMKKMAALMKFVNN
jgi:glycosyltransferase involved in cell wall biosynthesis